MPKVKLKTDAQKRAASAASRKWQLGNPIASLEGHYLSRYGIDFNAEWGKQKGLCAVCETPMQRNGKEPDSVCVDHDRDCCSGQRSCGLCFRGLIHRNCNLILGYAQDDLHVLRSATLHLSSSSG